MHLAHLATAAKSASAVCLRLLQEVVDSTDLPVHHAAHQASSHPNLGGCVDSPEAATIFLLCVGMAGLLLGTRLFRHHFLQASKP